MSNISGPRKNNKPLSPASEAVLAEGERLKSVLKQLTELSTFIDGISGPKGRSGLQTRLKSLSEIGIITEPIPHLMALRPADLENLISHKINRVHGELADNAQRLV